MCVELKSAIAFETGEGGKMKGIFLWLKHAPEDKGLGYWVYSKYQHLQLMPTVESGSRVERGQAVALSGKTGTVGGSAYGSAGYPHLHLTTRRSETGEQIKGSRNMDPLQLYLEAGINSKESYDSACANKSLMIPYMSADGQIRASDSQRVWPVTCKPK